jgi:hypothetical protein
MADNFSFLQQLLGGGKPQPAMLGSGGAFKAAQMAKYRPIYQQYSIRAQTDGQEPMPLEMFIAEMEKAQGGGQQQPTQAAPQQMANRGLGY